MLCKVYISQEYIDLVVVPITRRVDFVLKWCVKFLEKFAHYIELFRVAHIVTRCDYLVESIDEANALDGQPIDEVKTPNGQPNVEVKTPDEVNTLDGQSIDEAKTFNVQPNVEVNTLDGQSIDEAKTFNGQPNVEVNALDGQPIDEAKTPNGQSIDEANAFDGQPIDEAKTLNNQPIDEVNALNGQPNVEVNALDDQPNVEVNALNGQSIDEAKIPNGLLIDKEEDLDVQLNDEYDETNSDLTESSGSVQQTSNPWMNQNLNFDSATQSDPTILAMNRIHNSPCSSVFSNTSSKTSSNTSIKEKMKYPEIVDLALLNVILTKKALAIIKKDTSRKFGTVVVKHDGASYDIWVHFLPNKGVQCVNLIEIPFNYKQEGKFNPKMFSNSSGSISYWSNNVAKSVPPISSDKVNRYINHHNLTLEIKYDTEDKEKVIGVYVF